MVERRVLTDDPVNYGQVARRRIRVLVPRQSKIDQKDIRDLCMALAAAAEEMHGEQRAISVMVYTDLFSPLGILGAWDLCPGGQWRNAVDAPDLPRQWVVTRGADADMMLKLNKLLQAGVGRSRSRVSGNVESR